MSGMIVSETVRILRYFIKYVSETVRILCYFIKYVSETVRILRYFIKYVAKVCVWKCIVYLLVVGMVWG